MMVITHESHLDHGISVGLLKYLLILCQKREEFFIETLTLPEPHQVPCLLYGPVMRDAPISDNEEGLFYAARGDRNYASRLINRPARLTNKLTVIAGPHAGLSCVLFTAFGGPLAPKEPGDPTLADKDRAESIAFWSTHALGVES